MHPCFDKMIRIVAPFYRPVSLWVNSTQSVDDNSRYRLESQLSGGQRELCVRQGTRTLLALCYDFCMLYSFEWPDALPLCVCAFVCMSVITNRFVFCGGDEQSHDIYWMRWRCYTDRTKPEL